MENLQQIQKKILLQILGGKNIFVSGFAGSGKSFLVDVIKKFVKKRIYITSTTGISALGINGQTIHSFVGISNENDDIMKIINKITKRPELLYKIKIVEILIIDEISMMSDILFEKINLIFQNFRKKDLFFGGIQVILIGDFYQLPPVSGKYCFESEIWKQNIKDNYFLKKIFRQEDDVFINLLNNLRCGYLTQTQIKLLTDRILIDIPDNIPHLFPYLKQVNEYNQEKMDKIEGEYNIFDAKFAVFLNISDNVKVLTDLNSNNFYLKDLQEIFKKNNLISIKLKKGCRIMCIINLPKIDAKIVNGSFGTLIEIKPDIIVKFDAIDEPIILPNAKWEMDKKICDKNFTIQATQIPIIPAYALSTHKSQGQTLDSAVIDAANCFTYHQVYVALSRVKSLNGLYLTSFDYEKIKIHPAVKKYYSETEFIV